MIAQRTPTQRYAAYAIAALLIVAGVFGLLYNASSLFVAFSGAFDQLPDIPHFYTAFYVMSAICIVCYVAIIAASVGLCLGSATCARLLAMLLLFEVLYFFAIGAMWTLPTAGPGIGAATGIANGGLMVQFILLMPIWIPIVFAFLGLYRDAQPTVADKSPVSAPMPDGG